MTVKPDPFSILPRETLPGMNNSVRKSRIVLDNCFASLLKETRVHSVDQILLPPDSIKRPPLPDGTGQIINIGI